MLTPEAFDFVLNNELKRAMRSQNFLTLVLMAPRSEGRYPDEMVRDVARLIGREVRETDLLSVNVNGTAVDGAARRRPPELHARHRAAADATGALPVCRRRSRSRSGWRAVRPMAPTPKRCSASRPPER